MTQSNDFNLKPGDSYRFQNFVGQVYNLKIVDVRGKSIYCTGFSANGIVTRESMNTVNTRIRKYNAEILRG